MSIRIYPHRLGSASAGVLASALSRKLQARVLRLPEDSITYRPRPRHIIINWGNSRPPLWLANVSPPSRYEDRNRRPVMLNHWSQVNAARNKINAFIRFNQCNIPHPLWTTMPSIADEWLKAKEPVVCRHTITSYGGQGIEIVWPGNILPSAPLYTKYYRRESEWRIHVMNAPGATYNKVILVQQKLRRHDCPDDAVNWQVRNHRNGWIFANQPTNFTKTLVPEGIEAAQKSVIALGLSFGAVDLLQQKNGKVYVLEVNTAPALEGLTLDTYAASFIELLNNTRYPYGGCTLFPPGGL